MTIITKASAKNYFLTGAFPTQNQFADTIDTYLGLGESGSQTVAGPITFGANITASADISAPNGKISASAAAFTAGIVVSGALQAAGGISSISGTSISGLTGTGNLVLSSNPAIVSAALTTPSLGVATATTINGAALDNLAWTAYTPTLTAGTGTFTSATATGRYKQIGKTIFFCITVNITTNGTAANSVRTTLPTTAGGIPSVANGRATAVSGKQLQGEIANGTNFVLILNYDNTYPGASGETLEITGLYETS